MSLLPLFLFALCSFFQSVETCIKMCGLEGVADASVGSLGIEHRKRTTIAVELAAKVFLSTLL